MRFFGSDNKHKRTIFVSASAPLGTGLSAVALMFALTSAAHAQLACPPDVITRPPPAEAQPGADGILPIELEGDEVESVKQSIVILRGNAFMKRGREAVFGDKLSYFRDQDELEGEGNVVMYSAHGDRVEMDRVKLQVQTHIGDADNVRYRFVRRNQRPNHPNQAYVDARGEAEKMYLEGHDVSRLENVTYTTCVEGKDDVILKAKEMTLDRATGRGLAKNVTVKFKNIPIFYSPVLSFPIDDERKTGFLFPSVGFFEGSGMVLITPFYVNLAPQMDATLIPRYYSDRGVQLGTEFRYLTERAEGYVYGEYLPSDSEFNDQDRSAFTYKHDHEFTERIDGKVNVQWVSDEDYFDDFSNDIQVSSATFLPQTASLSYTGEIWRLNADLSSYLSVDDSIQPVNEPHDRLPRLRARGKFPKGPYGLKFGFESELVNFAHDERLEGWRFDATPSIERKFENLWGYVKPELAIRHTSYNLDNVAAGENDSPDRTVPIFSLDSGIFLERVASWFGTPMIHTLEPRAFYVYIPEENQDDLPTFDTGDVNLNNFGNLYRENRFYGRDRVGDTSQVTLAITSRMIDNQTGVEWMRASIGQIFFLRDRNVTRNGDPLTEDSSDLLAQLRATLTDRWSVYGFGQYDSEENELLEARGDIYYRANSGRYLDLQYRFSRGGTEQISLVGRLPIKRSWTFLIKDRYSIRDSENLETSVGVEYNGCCWKARLFGQRRVESDETFRHAIIFEFELTGLTTIRSGL